MQTDIIHEVQDLTYLAWAKARNKSARANLELIPGGRYPVLRPLKEKDRRFLFDGLETVLPQVWQDKIWEMLWRRWCSYEDLRCKG